MWTWDLTMTICSGPPLNTNLFADWSQNCCCCLHLSPSVIPQTSCWRWRPHHQFSRPQLALWLQGEFAQHRPLWVCPRSCLGLLLELRTQRRDYREFFQPQLWKTIKANHTGFCLMIFMNSEVSFLWKSDRVKAKTICGWFRQHTA